MTMRAIALGASLAAAALAGCADGSSGLLSTASVTPATVTTPAAKVDPACVALTARIDTLRKEGFVEKVEKASVGKSASVTVKRESLAKMAELEKANAEFQTKCSAPLTAAALAPKPGATVAAAAPAAAPAPAAKP